MFTEFLHIIDSNVLESYGPLLMSEVCFPSTSWEGMDLFWQSFVYALIWLRLLVSNICQFVTELWPLIDVRISFLLEKDFTKMNSVLLIY